MAEIGRRERRWLKRAVLAVTVLFCLLAVLVIIGVVFAPDYNTRKTPAGVAINTVRYLILDEHTRIFISVWVPPDLKPGEKIPTLIRTERYADQLESGWLGKALQFYTGEEDPNYSNAKELLSERFAFVFIQSPGSCQSSGPRPSEYPPQEVDSIGLAIDWIVSQPWSNQRVGAFGGSYSGTTADMSCAAMRPQLRAVYPSKPDFDPYCGVIRPGGLGSVAFIHIWGSMIRAMDQDDIVGTMEIITGEPFPFWKRWLYLSMIRGLKRPERRDMDIFRQAMQDHRANSDVVDRMVRDTEFRDSRSSVNGALSIDEIALYRYKKRIEQASVNTYTHAGWIDAGVAEGALEKFLTFNTPQKLVLMPTGHRLNEFVDLFGDQSGQKPHEPGWKESDMLDFFAQHLKNGADSVEPRRIIYFTYGANTWHETAVWPPSGMKPQEWFLAGNHSLSVESSSEAGEPDHYRVDFTADSGDTNRWMSQMGRSVKYGDRSQEDRKLLTYTSNPLTNNVEVTGSPTLYLHVASTQRDGAFYVYLEDVGPTGRVTYLTEGLLRAMHRSTRPIQEAPYVPLGVYHSFYKTDALPLMPGEVTEIPITLLPISALIRKGHCIRVAIAGYDKTMNARYPESGTPTLTVWRDAGHPSRIIIPTIPR